MLIFNLAPPFKKSPRVKFRLSDDVQRLEVVCVLTPIPLFNPFF